MTLSTLIWGILAQEDKQPAADPPQGSLMDFLPLLLPFMVLFYFFFIRPQKNKEKSRRSALDELKKNDRVHTIGGIIGTITSFSSDKKEVTIRVDDNSRLTMMRSAIHGIYAPEADEEKTEKK